MLSYSAPRTKALHSITTYKDAGRSFRPVSLCLICTQHFQTNIFSPVSTFMDCTYTTSQVQSPVSLHLQRQDFSLVIHALLQLGNNEDACNLASHLQQTVQAQDQGGEIGEGFV